MSELWILKEANLFESPIFFYSILKCYFLTSTRINAWRGKKTVWGKNNMRVQYIKHSSLWFKSTPALLQYWDLPLLLLPTFFVNINFIQSSNDSQLTGRIYLWVFWVSLKSTFFFFASQIQTGDTDSVCRENKTLQIQNKAVWLVYKNDMTVSVWYWDVTEALLWFLRCSGPL